MINFSKRASQKELFDGNNIPFEAVRQNLSELEFINSNLGGHAITIAGFEKLAGKRGNISVCEVGCGGGDNLNAIYRCCSKKHIELTLTGIDKNAECITYARKNTAVDNKNFIVADYRDVDFEGNTPDIIFASLCCHHFTNVELVAMLQWMQANSKVGFFINDLHRHPLAYYFIKLATKVFSRSYLVKNDAPLSVLKGFTKKEWIGLLQQAGITDYIIQWKWAFRHLIIAPSKPLTSNHLNS